MSDSLLTLRPRLSPTQRDRLDALTDLGKDTLRSMIEASGEDSIVERIESLLDQAESIGA